MRRADSDAAWRAAGAVGAVIALVFGFYELAERAWFSSWDPGLLRILHLCRGVAATVLGSGIVAWRLGRSGIALPERVDAARQSERLDRKLSWLISLRWLAVAGIVLALVWARPLGALADGAEPPLWFGAALLSCVNAWLEWRRRHGGLGEPALTLQLAFDSAALAYLLHYSGGLENPFFLLYLFHAQTAAILLPGREAARLTLWSALLLLLSGLGEQSGALAHHPLLILPHPPGGDCLARNPSYLWPMAAAFLVVHAGTAFFTATVMARFRADNDRILAAERLAALGRIVGFVAHEVNNPIGVISGRAQLALSRPRQLDDPERMRVSMETISRQADRVASLVRGLLAAVNPGSSLKDEIRVADILEETTARLHDRFRAAGVRLELEARTRTVLRDARFSETAQIFSSLLLNALEASGHGKTVRVRCAETPGWIGVAIEDEGSGIAPEHLGRIFEPFFTTKPSSGAGLGLALCRALVKAHGGEIAVESRPGRGSVFTVKLPAARPPPEGGGKEAEA